MMPWTRYFSPYQLCVFSFLTSGDKNSPGLLLLVTGPWRTLCEFLKSRTISLRKFKNQITATLSVEQRAQDTQQWMYLSYPTVALCVLYWNDNREQQASHTINKTSPLLTLTLITWPNNVWQLSICSWSTHMNELESVFCPLSPLFVFTNMSFWMLVLCFRLYQDCFIVLFIFLS